jgi:DNA-binding transcriptional MerR regulator
MVDDTMRTLTTQDAARQLNVSTSALRSWESRYGYPTPARTAGGHRHYAYGEILALRDALESGLSISSAVGRARETLIAISPQALTRALLAYEFEQADSAMEAALTLQTLERAIEDLLLAAMRELAASMPSGSAQWSLAATWADDWLRRARRLCRESWNRSSILIGDASAHRDMDALHLRALELFCLRGGLSVTTVPVDAPVGIHDVLRVVEPDVVVLAGSGAEPPVLARCVYALQQARPPRTMAIYRRRDASLPGHSITLADLPSQAHQQLLELTAEPAREVA